MNKEIFFTCCTHFYHDNVLRFTDNNGVRIRPEFDNIDQMNEYIIEMWNENISPMDTVYHLGDVIFGKLEEKEKFKKDIFPKLNGRKKNLILGNHDDGRFMANIGWSKIRTQQTLDDLGLFLSHYPIHESSLWSFRQNKQLINVHGHIHHLEPPEGPYVNVCVERNKYKPFHLDEIYQLAKDKNFNNEMVMTL